MTHRAFLLPIVLHASFSFAQPAPLAQPWDAPYAGEDAAGKHVIGLWNFDEPNSTQDASGHKLECKIEGAKLNPAGKFGGALESFRGFPTDNKRHAAVTKNTPALSPRGAFTIELWINPSKELTADYGDAYLIDKKYASHNDYQLILTGDRSGAHALRAVLGFGGDSATLISGPIKIQTGQWRHVAFAYDGNGTGTFFVDGQIAGVATAPGRKAITPGTYPLSIGDRIGSNYHGFPGLIDQVRLCEGALEFRRAKFERTSDRSVFVRMEKDAKLTFAVTNLQKKPLEGATVSIGLAGLNARETNLDAIAPGAAQTIQFPLDTTLRPGTYQLAAQLKAGTLETRDTFPVTLVPRQTPDRFPVVMWGVYGQIVKEIDRLKRIGFTHALGPGADFKRIWEADAPTDPDAPERMAENKAMLDAALANDLYVASNLSPGHSLLNQKALLRINRKGEVQEKRPDICALDPRIETFCYNVGASVAKAYGHFPALVSANIHTEVRDVANLCFHPRDLEAYKKFSGRDIPPEATSKYGVDYAKLKGFPASRVISDDDPLYLFFKWFWKQGDGWNGLNNAVDKGLKSTGRSDLWTWFDPADRVAKTWGSGGNVDVISQWTYSYPDPIRIALATDELFAMAEGTAAKQNVMKMTQIIWYRGQTAPMPKPGALAPAWQSDWERQQPDAPFITIAPLQLREAFWTKISRPIRGIMYHGWQSLVPCDGVQSYRYTHPQTQHELARLVHEVIQPLGPTLLNVPGVRADVAVLQSFASEMFARRGTYGWCGNWAGDAYEVLLYAHLQPQVVYDETITQRGLDGFKILVMPDCDVITEKMAQRVAQFQARGGIIIGDDHTAPAIKPDIVLTPYKRTGRNDQDKKELLALAQTLRQQLGAKYARYADSSNPDVIPYRRQFKNTDYIFLVNDKREYGNYVGHHAVVMENGLPSTATLTMGRDSGVIYDLTMSAAVPARSANGKISADVQLGPCDGALYMITPRPIESLRIDAPKIAQRGGAVKLSVEVLSDQGKPVEAVVPMEIIIRDASGKAAEFSGFYAAVNGRVQIDLAIASNDPFGAWQIEARELASGRRASHALHITAPDPWPPLKGPVDKELANPVQPKG